MPADLPAILPVDDDPEAIFLIRRQLVKAGTTNPILTFGHGLEILEFLERLCATAPPDRTPDPCLMVLDIKRPAMNGFDMLAWKREQPTLKTLRTIMLSTSDAPEDKQRAQQLGADGYLVKYPSSKELMACLTPDAR